MALPTDPLGWAQYLSVILASEQNRLQLLDDEYEMEAPRAYMHPDLVQELGDRIEQVVIAWPQLVVDSVEERLEVEGFRLPDADDADVEMWRVWQANGMDEESQLGRVDALVMGRSYLAVGANEDDTSTPLVTVESPLEVYADVDPRTRKVRAALRRYSDEATIVRPREDYATLYLPNETIYYDIGKDWKETGRDEHKLGEVPLIPLVNRGRLSSRSRRQLTVSGRLGRSELDPILPLARAANKIATDMMVASEGVAIPLRGLWGIGPDDLEDQDGNKLTAMQAILGKLLMLPVEGGREFQFPAADLSNFHKTINQLAHLVASIAGLPSDYLGLTTENPPSAESRRAGEIRLIKRCERKQVPFGGAYEHTQRVIRRFQDGGGPVDKRLRSLETIWRDPATPTVAAMADAAVKLRAEGISTLRQAREDVRYSQGQIRRMEKEDEQEARRQAQTVFGVKPDESAGEPAPAAGEPGRQTGNQVA
ncbi:MAG TPA: phage portal protein [Mycobacteriales bacterium]|jgi:Phage portal protein, SPP1 Gp6-like.